MFIGGLLARTGDKWVDCSQDARACEASRDDLGRLEALRDDLVGGRQYSLDMLGESPRDDDWKMEINRQYGTCTFNVE
ncbi:hypothetical protein, partial [Paraburkholderia sp. SIMBA_054]|uniref:hypothetical protein n=1 Tax=Paraburkholderia sp. SIMBA_054 TaxID=3085795 RepID=UPI00397C9DDC